MCDLANKNTKAIPPCPFCDSTDDVVTLRDRLRDAEQLILQMRETVQVPDGWVIVPTEPTTDMECAADHDDCASPDAARSIYKAMISRRPPFPLDIVTITVLSEQDHG